MGRILESDFNSEDDPFFTDAHSSFDTERVTRGKIVKIREMHRRTPHHYKWINEDGGKWVLKNLGHLCFTEIDTSSDILKYTF